MNENAKNALLALKTTIIHLKINNVKEVIALIDQIVTAIELNQKTK